MNPDPGEAIIYGSNWIRILNTGQKQMYLFEIDRDFD